MIDDFGIPIVYTMVLFGVFLGTKAYCNVHAITREQFTLAVVGMQVLVGIPLMVIVDIVHDMFNGRFKGGKS
jgi:hypothetical protein